MDFNWKPFLFSTILVSLSPGVNSLSVFRTASTFGMRQSFLLMSGQLTSLMLQMTLVCFGLSLLSPLVVDAVKLVGAGYLVWLGVGILRSAWKSSSNTPVEDDSKFGFAQGFLINALNPKAIVFQAAFVPQFLTGSETNLFQYAVMGSVMLSIEFAALLLYAFMGKRLSSTEQFGTVSRWLDLCIGVLFILLGLMAGLSFFH